MKQMSRKTTVLSLATVVTAMGVMVIYAWLAYKKTHITTDDAFIEGRIHTIAAKVPGTVTAVRVEDNQLVNKGTLLLEIDEVDYEVKVKEASSALDVERSAFNEISKTIDMANKRYAELKFAAAASRAMLELQTAKLNQAERDIRRAANLFESEVISKEQWERSATDHDVYRAAVNAAREQLKQAEASLETQGAFIAQAEAALQAQRSRVQQREASLDAAALNKSYTRVYAPINGQVTKKSVEQGNQIQAGQPLMALVPLDDIWIIANYKETQLERVRPGQKARIRVDTYPGKVFEGKVDSIMAGTGAAFSLFPPENATGNYVKVVQRIPVKIVLNRPADPYGELRVGMSVIPTIHAK